MRTAVDELYCLLVPLADERLLVPRSCVTEVINYQAPTPLEGQPPWYLGTVAWGGRRVPLVSFEAACGRNAHFAVLTQGFPQLVRLSPDVVHADDSRSFGDRVPVICQVRMVNEHPLVPDFDRLERQIAEETRTAA